MVQRCELTFVFAVGFELCQTFADHLNEQFLGLNLTYHHVSVRVTVERKLLRNTFRQRAEQLARSFAEFALHIFAFRIIAVEGSELFVGCEHVVQLLNQHTHSGDELDEAFGDKNGTEVQTCVRAVDDDLHDVLHDVVKRHLLRLYLFGNKADIRLALKRALQCDVTGATAHQTDEMPVFLRRVGIALDVTNQFGIGLTCGVETEGGLNHLVLEVAVDGLRAADNLNAALFLQVVLSEYASVGVRVVATDDDYGLDT